MSSLRVRLKTDKLRARPCLAPSKISNLRELLSRNEQTFHNKSFVERAHIVGTITNTIVFDIFTIAEKRKN